MIYMQRINLTLSTSWVKPFLKDLAVLQKTWFAPKIFPKIDVIRKLSLVRDKNGFSMEILWEATFFKYNLQQRLQNALNLSG